MSSSSNDKLIEEAVQDFSQGLHSDLPLRHFAEFHDQKELKNVVDLQKEKVFRKVFDKNWTREKEEIVALVKKVNRRLDNEVVAEWLAKNREHEIRSLSFLQKWVDMLCEDYNKALDYQLLLIPDIDVDSLKNYVRSRKLFAVNCFDGIWKPGNGQMQEERKSKLEKHLKAKEEEVFEKHKRNLESKSAGKGRKLLEEVRSILLERSRQLKCYVVRHQEEVSTDILKGMVEEMREYLLNGKGSTLKDSNAEIHNKLVETFDGEIQFLADEPKETMAAKDNVIGYAEKFDEKLRFCCFDNVVDVDNTQEKQENSYELDPNEETQRSIRMKQLMKEVKGEQLHSLNLGEPEPDVLPDESNDDDRNRRNAEPGVVVEEKRLKRRSSRRLKRSVQDIDPSFALAPKVPQFKKQQIGQDIAKKVGRRITVDIHRHSSRLNKATASNSIPAQTQTTFSRKNFHKEKNDKKRTSRKEGILHPNCEDDDTIVQDSMMSTSSSAPLMATKSSIENEDCLEVSVKQPKKSKYPVPQTTRNVRPIPSSERPQPNGSKLRRSKWQWVCRSDEKLCPYQITILKEDCPKYSCNVCKKKFKQNRYLKYHGEFCGTAKQKSFNCDVCGKDFHRKAHLVQHTRMHTGEKPFQCPHCPKGFSWNENLQSHIRCHTKEKPFQCPKCPMRFTQKGGLSRHIPCHAKEGRHICKLCNLTFVSGHSLHEHNLNHKEKLPLSCSYCNKGFGLMYKLRNHVIIHGDERPFKCIKCGVFFAKMECLQSHCERAHSQPRQIALKLAYDAAVAYLLKENKNEGSEGCLDMPARRINAAVVDRVIKKKNLLIPNAQ